jgi:hypothetical protein
MRRTMKDVYGRRWTPSKTKSTGTRKEDINIKSGVIKRKCIFLGESLRWSYLTMYGVWIWRVYNGV